MTEWAQLVSTLGFPIVMCFAMAWFVKYQNDKHSKQIEEINSQHRVEIDNMRTAIENNTIAITKLCEKLETKN